MHSGNGDITDLGRRFVVCFDHAIEDAGLPADAEFRAALHDYMQWAVDDVRLLTRRRTPHDAAVVLERPAQLVRAFVTFGGSGKNMLVCAA